MKIGGLLVGLSLILAGCGGSKQEPPAEVPTPVKPVPPPAPPPEPVDDSQTFAGDTWQLTVPSTVERKRTDDENLVFAGTDSSEKRLILLVREEVKGNSDTSAARADLANSLVLGGLSNGFVPTTESTGNLNGVPFTKVELVKPQVAVTHNWVLVQSGHGYALACGGAISNAAKHATVCATIATSLKLK